MEDTLNRLTTAVAIFGPDQRLSFANAAYAKLWGLDPVWLETKPSDGDILEKLREMARLPEQRDFPAWKRERLRLYTRLTEEPQEELWHLSGGKTLRVTAAPHPLGGLIFITSDVTDQLSLERSFNKMAKVQSATIDALPDGIAVFGSDGRLKLHNAAFAAMWRLPPHALQGQPRFAEVFQQCRDMLPDEGHWSWLTSRIVAGAADGKTDTHGPFAREDGVHVAFTTAPLPDGSLMITVRDVSDSVAKETALQERNAALLAADKLKSEFISHVSYQLRTPLTSIAGFAEVLRDGVAAGKLNPRQLSYVEDVTTAAKTLETLINDILDLALIEAGRLELDLGETQLETVVEAVRPLIAARAEKAKIALEIGVHPETGGLLADEKRLRQIVYNLAVNAIEHTPPLGTVSIGADANGDMVRLFVNDTGVGMPAEHQAIAFEKFESKTTAKNARRAGLGLALVKSFVQLHGGWVSLTSQEGKGTSVMCHLPRRALQDLAEPQTLTDEKGVPLDALRIPAE
jgi:signal transduction histidine kinase